MVRKWYVVTAGKQPGIYTTWEETAQMVLGVPGAIYKSYSTDVEAFEAYGKARMARRTQAIGSGFSVMAESDLTDPAVEQESRASVPSPTGRSRGGSNRSSPRASITAETNASSSSPTRSSTPSSQIVGVATRGTRADDIDERMSSLTLAANLPDSPTTRINRRIASTSSWTNAGLVNDVGHSRLMSVGGESLNERRDVENVDEVNNSPSARSRRTQSPATPTIIDDETGTSVSSSPPTGITQIEGSIDYSHVHSYHTRPHSPAPTTFDHYCQCDVICPFCHKPKMVLANVSLASLPSHPMPPPSPPPDLSQDISRANDIHAATSDPRSPVPRTTALPQRLGRLSPVLGRHHESPPLTLSLLDLFERPAWRLANLQSG